MNANSGEEEDEYKKRDNEDNVEDELVHPEHMRKRKRRRMRTRWGKLRTGKVHLPIWTQQKGKLLALEDPDSRNGAAIVDSKEDGSGKGIFFSLSNSWNIPAIHEEFMKVWMSSLGKRYSEYHRDQPSLSKCSPKHGSASESGP
ncbi:hypothetical protein P7K49_003589 [Saguinus oedipus]|uniref:Uncharacterized protein n=1 Tax=Saguinus oedipus TaxID=9490 RepID=A0ABQ9W4Y7_SAGOE|nr:hypothetical protein P7K49_003589 [Saguinus oedipus]